MWVFLFESGPPPGSRSEPFGDFYPEAAQGNLSNFYPDSAEAYTKLLAYFYPDMPCSELSKVITPSACSSETHCRLFIDKSCAEFENYYWRKFGCFKTSPDAVTVITDGYETKIYLYDDFGRNDPGPKKKVQDKLLGISFNK